MRQSREEKEMDALIANTFNRVCAGVQINILDLPIIFQAARDAIKSGCDKQGLEQSIKDCVEKIRYN